MRWSSLRFENYHIALTDPVMAFIEEHALASDHFRRGSALSRYSSGLHVGFNG